MLDALPPDLAAAIDAARERLGPFADVRFRAEVESTNDLALALASKGHPEGTSVIADQQRAGRGRRGRDWFSPPGAGLYLSTILRPDLTQGGLPILTLAAGVAMAAAVETISGLPVELKWPNDLVIGRPWRKLGGALAEAVTSGGRIDAVVVGMGINLQRASYPPEIAHRATSIETELGRPIDRAPVATALLEQMRVLMERLHAGDRTFIGAAWRRYAIGGLAGAPIRWQDQRGERRGRAMDIDSDGALLAGTENGVERIIAGEVTWEK